MGIARVVLSSLLGRTLDVLDDLTVGGSGARARHLSYPLLRRHCAVMCDVSNSSPPCWERECDLCFESGAKGRRANNTVGGGRTGVETVQACASELARRCSVGSLKNNVKMRSVVANK